MFNSMTALHLVTAIFLIGPLAYATTAAGRALRTGDAPGVTHAARTEVAQVGTRTAMVCAVGGTGAVIIDSIVVRRILVPALFAFGGGTMWWPGRVHMQENRAED